jgi:hypothetical protein
MSTPNVSSLSDLAKKCIVLEELMNLEDWTYEIFLDVQGRINSLQVDCPNEESILDARIRWYERGLENFKECIPQMLETPPIDHRSRVEGQIMDLYTMDFFLRRHYLGIVNIRDEFPRLFYEVVTTCRRTMKAANKRGHNNFAFTLLNLRTRLEDDLLLGRLR